MPGLDSFRTVGERTMAPMSPDPIRALFDVTAGELFAEKNLVVRHGPVERLPAFLRSGLMDSVDGLCRGYSGPLQVSNGDTRDGVQITVVGAHPSALLRLGLTVFFTDLDGALPEAAPWLRALEASLGLPECAGLSAFANAPGSGLPLHHDRFDQLLIQLRGQKEFRYAPNSYVENPDVAFSPVGAAPADWAQAYRHGFPRTSDEILARGLTTVTLRPGSALFMPAGTWHTTAGQAGEALSAVVVVRAPSRLALVLNLLRHYAGQSPAWRARSYGGWSSDPAAAEGERQELGALMADLGERLRSLAAGDAHRAWWSDAFTTGAQGHYPMHDRFARYIRLPNSTIRYDSDDATATELVKCTVSSGPTDRPQAETALAISPEVRPVIEWVVRTAAAFSVEEAGEAFPDCEREDLETLFAWLSHAALIRPVPAPEWDRR